MSHRHSRATVRSAYNCILELAAAGAARASASGLPRHSVLQLATNTDTSAGRLPRHSIPQLPANTDTSAGGLPRHSIPQLPANTDTSAGGLPRHSIQQLATLHTIKDQYDPAHH